MLRLAAVVSGGKMNSSGNLSFEKKIFGWMDVWELNQKRCDRFGSKPMRLAGGGGVILAEGFHDWGRRPFPFSVIPWQFPYICWKKHGTCQGSWLVLGTSCCVELATF
jgi:hypothetical protein